MKAIRKKTAVLSGALIVGALFLGLVNRTPHGTECVSSTSPNGTYIAERCFIRMLSYRSENARYVARLFNAKSGSLLAESVFETSVPDLSWSSGFYFNDPQPRYIGPSVYFQRGGEDGDGSSISLPPSFWDRLLARRPRLDY